MMVKWILTWFTFERREHTQKILKLKIVAVLSFCAILSSFGQFGIISNPHIYKFSKIPEYITKTHLFKYIEISPLKTVSFQLKISDIFHISAQNIDCECSLKPPQRGGSNEYPQSMFLSINKKIMFTPINPSFTI